MDWLDLLFKKTTKACESDEVTDCGRLRELLKHGQNSEDHLGLAAEAKKSAQQAVREKRFDDAWRIFHAQKTHYLQHAKNYGHSTRQALALDGSVHEELANIRRLENNHEDALVHLLYCVITSTHPTKSQQQKISTYFNRCKFPLAKLSDAEALIETLRKKPDFRALQQAVANWRSGVIT